MTIQNSSAKTAVVFFSGKGHTREIAQRLAGEFGVEAEEIEPAEHYSDADLNYTVDDCRANRESFDPQARPALAADIPNVSGYDIVFLGYPIWWGDAAAPLRTFVESVNWAGKTVVPFCTSGGSSITRSVSTLSSLAGAGEWHRGIWFRAHASGEAIAAELKRAGL
ncbi:flavodoxin [Actinobaculum sp. 313]|uniref:flavodoxin n=1 Tax=Actinobaculum sp. 313 TaxID=2495645 RepID=UPI000D527212|nr:flavodoxin [Actinobaculum sp. 313]AWE42107.1 flavodoxin [Actinobaculum sp. 313]